MPDQSLAASASASAFAADDDDERQQYRIATWTAEFADAQVEGRFRARSAAAMARYLRAALLVWAVSSVLFIFADYVTYVSGPEFWLTMTGRLALAAVLLAARALLGRRPDFAPSGVVLTPLLMIGFSFIFLYFFVAPPALVDRLLAITMVLLIGMFVFLPNRMVLSTFAAVYAVAGTVLALGLAGIERGSALVVQAMVLALPAATGLFAAYRLQVVHRREFAALEQAESEIERRRGLEAELQRQATTDPLTGLFNRREYEQLFQRELRRSQRHGRPLALCVLDIDHFKRVNDEFGHTAGDIALRAVADVCRDALREGDLIGRLGGEEFVMLLPDTTAAGAAAVAERVRARLAATEVVAGERRLRVTATIGVTELVAGDTAIADLVQRADTALYAGKHAGRDRICTA